MCLGCACVELCVFVCCLLADGLDCVWCPIRMRACVPARPRAQLSLCVGRPSEARNGRSHPPSQPAFRRKTDAPTRFRGSAPQSHCVRAERAAVATTQRKDALVSSPGTPTHSAIRQSPPPLLKASRATRSSCASARGNSAGQSRALRRMLRRWDDSRAETHNVAHRARVPSVLPSLESFLSLRSCTPHCAFLRANSKLLLPHLWPSRLTSTGLISTHGCVTCACVI
jgi:hypothetical protein